MTLLPDALWFAQRLRRPPLRTLRQFAEEEFVLTSGPYKGERFRCERQPWTGLFFDAVDSGDYRRVALLGCTQGAKTTCGFVMPTLWQLFERAETCIVGVPDLDMADDKFRVDLLPAVRSSRYERLLPETGPGSRAGRVTNTVTFRNGSVLKFMSGGGGDNRRSGFTSRRVVVTEVDKMDVVGGMSRETDKISQLEARSDAYGDAGELFLESTASFRTGRVWREYEAGTASRIACPCPHCRSWVTPEREHLTGWQTADTEDEAAEQARFICPACSVGLSEDDRTAMNRAAMLVHRGQRLDGGQVTGEPPKTRTLGFRYNAFNNLFWSPGFIGRREWKATRAPDEEAAKREILQFVWAQPYDPPGTDPTRATWLDVAKLAENRPQGMRPGDTRAVAVFADPGKYLLHFVASAFDAYGSPRVIDYGALETNWDDLQERAIGSSLKRLGDRCREGWGGETPEIVLVDSGNWTDQVYDFCAAMGRPYWPTKGVSGTMRRTWPAERYLPEQSKGGVTFISFDTDHWKTYAWRRLTQPMGSHGAASLFEGDVKRHTRFAKHCTAERTKDVYRGSEVLTIWENEQRAENHLWDCFVGTCLGGHMAGVRLTGGTVQSETAEAKAAPVPHRSRGEVPRFMRRTPFRRTYD